jgi:hypothetical protein
VPVTERDAETLIYRNRLHRRPLWKTAINLLMAFFRIS